MGMRAEGGFEEVEIGGEVETEEKVETEVDVEEYMGYQPLV